MRDINTRRELANYGVHMPDTAVYAMDEWRGDYQLAMDAQPQLITQANAGIPAFLANIVDPQVIEVVIAPLLASTITGGEIKKGDWVTQSLMMPLAEPVGYVVSYGDYDNGGQVDANVEFVSRQPWHYQTIKRIGERQEAQWGLAAIDQNALLDRSVAVTFGQMQNRSYFYGVAGLQNYGILNDPGLITPIVPNTKVAGGTTWVLATADEIYGDFLKLFTQLQTQMGGNLQMNDRFVVALSTTRMIQLAKLNAFGISVRDMLNKAFPNMEIVAAPEYSTGSGELMQMIIPEYRGAQTFWTAFTEKFRAHNIVQELSAWAQKFSAGTWGAILRRPICVASMLGI